MHKLSGRTRRAITRWRSLRGGQLFKLLHLLIGQTCRVAYRALAKVLLMTEQTRVTRRKREWQGRAEICLLYIQ